MPVTDQVIYDHLNGVQTIGVYPLLKNDHCYFLAVDFDEENWKDDAKSFMLSCKELSIPAVLEISRSGKGAHIWIFMEDATPARIARQLGTILISHTCQRTRQLSLSSYDRFFPNQDTMPQGGFGNLIALPLQKIPRKKGFSVFVDENFTSYPDQWNFLASVQKLNRKKLDEIVSAFCQNQHPLDIAFPMEDENAEPWKQPKTESIKIQQPLPENLSIVLANQIYIEKADLPQALSNRIIRLAAFQNPDFYKAQAMRLPIWNKPRIIGCAENFQKYIGIPRGCLDALIEMLTANNIQINIQDNRLPIAQDLNISFTGKLRKEQNEALQEMLKYDIGVLCAPTAFGKTVTAAALIAARKEKTLILLNRGDLLRQWQDRMVNFLSIPKKEIGVFGAGKKKLSGRLDIALLQSLSRQKNVADILENYGQIIVDECHHISAFSFEQVIKQSKARYIMGLTATPFRRDGHHPIVFMQCGTIRHQAKNLETMPVNQELFPRIFSMNIPPETSIQELYRIITNDISRNRRIADDITIAYNEGRKIVVLTERTEHIDILRNLLPSELANCWTLHGRMTKKERMTVLAELNALENSAPRVLLATGRLIGEGFDHPPLDTLVLAMPISWKGTIQQYAGRLHRESAGKESVRIYDYAEQDEPRLFRMWHKREKSYKSMGYKIRELEK
ncbi:DEAD/DEAH box helicase [Fibrobacterales bacterium]|nr:DEAD/DEAH box helicase [Fibrobacterales bacterium]